MDRLGRDDLFYYIVDGQVDKAIDMISKIDNVDFKDANGYTYLHIAVQNESLDIIKLLISKGADINAIDIFGKTPLMIAISAFCGDRTIIDYLIKNGADIELKTKAGVSTRKLAQMKGLELY